MSAYALCDVIERENACVSYEIGYKIVALKIAMKIGYCNHRCESIDERN